MAEWNDLAEAAERGDSKAYEALEKAAEKGEPDGQFYLAGLLFSAERYDEASKWYERAKGSYSGTSESDTSAPLARLRDQLRRTFFRSGRRPRKTSSSSSSPSEEKSGSSVSPMRPPPRDEQGLSFSEYMEKQEQAKVTPQPKPAVKADEAKNPYLEEAALISSPAHLEFY